jgi:hypothetical protein
MRSLPPLTTVVGRPDTRLLGELLLEAGHITAAQLDEALKVQVLEGERIGEALVRLAACSEWAVCQALARQFALPSRESLLESDIDDALIEGIAIGWSRNNAALPVRMDRELGVLTVAIADPTKLFDIDDLARIHDAEIETFLLPRCSSIW